MLGHSMQSSRGEGVEVDEGPRNLIAIMGSRGMLEKSGQLLRGSSHAANNKTIVAMTSRRLTTQVPMILLLLDRDSCMSGLHVETLALALVLWSKFVNF